MVDAAEMYVLTREAALINFPDPGFHYQVDGTLSPVAQRDANVICSAAITVYIFQQNVKGAVNKASNKAVPKVYRPNPNVRGVKECCHNNNPPGIIARLTTRYGQK